MVRQIFGRRFAAGAGLSGPRRGRRGILEAAARVLINDRGASMQEISEAAGVGRTTLHRHFPGREDLIRAIALDALDECEVVIEAARLEEGSVAEALSRLAAGLTPIGARFHFLLYEVGLEDDPEFVAVGTRVMEPIELLVRRGLQDGTFRPEIPVAWILDAFEALVFAAWEGIHRGRLAPLDAPHLVTNTLLSGLGGPVR